LIVGLYLGRDRCAVCVMILRLHYGDRLRRSPSTAAEEYCGYDGCGTNDLLQVRSLLDMSISPRLPVGARFLWRGQNALIARPRASGAADDAGTIGCASGPGWHLLAARAPPDRASAAIQANTRFLDTSCSAASFTSGGAGLLLIIVIVLQVAGRI
jgi:hypothetical protein